MSWQITSAPDATKAQLERNQPGEIILAIRTDDETGETELLVGYDTKAPRWVSLGEAAAVFHSRD